MDKNGPLTPRTYLSLLINSNEGYTFLKLTPQTLALIKMISFI